MSDGAQIEPTGALSGELFGGRYRLGSMLGQGGMGVVYRAAQESLSRPVALKVLQPSLVHDGDAVLRFKAEAERAGRLAHPHIVQILDFGREPSGAVWIAMELLEGESLAARIERAPLSEAEVVRIALETLSALEAAHGASLVHRDLKPDNVFLARVPGIGVSVKVLDFGIAKLLEADGAAKLTATGMLIGTPLYMAPEQAKGEEVNTRADLYSLGALLYEALTQRPPLTGKTYPALLLAVMTETPRPLTEMRPGLSPAIAAVIGRAMAKDPSARFESAGEMAAALRAVTPSEVVPSALPQDAALGLANTMATPMPAVPTPMGMVTDMASSPTMSASSSALVPPTGLGPTPTYPMPTNPAPQAVVAAAPPPRSPLLWVGLLVAVLGGAVIALLALLIFRPAPTAPAAPTETLAVREPSTEAPATAAGPPPAPAAAAMLPMVAEPSAPPVVPVETIAEPTEDEEDTEPSRGTTRPSGRTTRSHASDDSTPVRGSSSPRGRYSPRVSYSGGTFAGMARSADLREPIAAAGDWGTCWPSDVEPPTASEGRSFVVDLSGEGRVTSVSPATPASGLPAAFATCVMRRMRDIRFPAPAAGEPIQVRVNFGID